MSEQSRRLVDDAKAAFLISRIDDCFALLRKAAKADPRDGNVPYWRAVMLRDIGRLDESLSLFDQLTLEAPTNAVLRYARSLALLKAGHFNEGWAEHELRYEAGAVRRSPLPQPFWNGQTTDKTLLVYSEQGLGDTLQFARYLQFVRQRCRRLIFNCHKALVPLISRRGIADVIVPDGSALPEFDQQVALLSLPHVLGLPEPADGPKPPYIVAGLDRQLISRPSIGISWQGSKTYWRDAHRSIPFPELSPLLDMPGFRFISLQKGCEVFHPKLIQIKDLDKRAPFLDSAGIIQQLELFITSDTSLAHLAGALNVQTWLLTSAACDWRWGTGDDRTPWYPSMRLFRQRRLRGCFKTVDLVE